MSFLLEDIKSRINKLKEIIGAKEESLAVAPEGAVIVSKSNGRIQFYFKDSSAQGKKRYLQEKERELVIQLCQKDYDQKTLAAAKKELKQLEKLVNRYPAEVCEQVYDNLSDIRKTFVNPIEIPEDEFVKRWLDESYDKKSFQEGAPEYYTEKGERVRSKTEILIANALVRNGIPYKYECPLYLKGYGRVHPDFTVLNVKDRKIIFWEHLGMMDNPEYAENAVKKIEAYEKNHIFPGDNLILTYETMSHPVNSRILEAMIKKYLK